MSDDFDYDAAFDDVLAGIMNNTSLVAGEKIESHVESNNETKNEETTSSSMTDTKKGLRAASSTTQPSASHQYTLSCELGAFLRSAHDVCAVDNDTVVAHSGEGEITLFRRSSKTWERQVLPSPHSDNIKSITCFPASAAQKLDIWLNALSIHDGADTDTASARSGPLFATCSKDLSVKLWNSEGKVVHELPDPSSSKDAAHSIAVGTVTATSKGALVTGGWDGAVIYWKPDGTIAKKIDDENHQYCVQVLGLPSGNVVSASYKNIIILDGQGNKVTESIGITNHVVKRLALHPKGFIAASNDGMVYVMDESLNIITQWQAHDHFIHALDYNPTTQEIITGSEDSSLKIFSAGTLVQRIPHPLGVSNIKQLPNGDIVTCCYDGKVRVFTRSADRYASDDQVKLYNEELKNKGKKNQNGSSSGGVDMNNLPDAEVLQTPGEKDGQIKVVKENSKPMVYQWSKAESKWGLVGEAVGAPDAENNNDNDNDNDNNNNNKNGNGNGDGSAGKTHTVYIDLADDMENIPLTFKDGDDPREVAENFVQKYGLPRNYVQNVTTYVDQILNP